MENCKKCNKPVEENFCPNCGLPAKLKRINGNFIVREIATALYADKGMFFTIIKMLTKPGKSVRQYINEDRSRFMKPISFVFVTSLIYTILAYFFPLHIEDLSLQVESTDLDNMVFRWTQDYSAYTNLLASVFMAFGIKLCFRKSGYNLFEIYVLLCFVNGVVSLFESISAIFYAVTQIKLFFILAIFESLYIVWAVGQFFGEKKASSYIKALLSYFFGFLIIIILTICFTRIYFLFHS